MSDILVLDTKYSKSCLNRYKVIANFIIRSRATVSCPRGANLQVYNLGFFGDNAPVYIEKASLI